MAIRTISHLLLLLLLLIGSTVAGSQARPTFLENEVVFAVSTSDQHEVVYHGKRVRWSTAAVVDISKRPVPGGPDGEHHGLPPQSP